MLCPVRVAMVSVVLGTAVESLVMCRGFLCRVLRMVCRWSVCRLGVQLPVVGVRFIYCLLIGLVPLSISR